MFYGCETCLSAQGNKILFKVFQNKVMRTFGLQRDADGENYIMRTFIIYSLHQILLR
jgi:hypothetical protein